MKLTIDTSVAVKLVIDEPGTDAAQALVESDATLIAPDLIHAEMANALWANALSNRIARQEAQELTLQWSPLIDEYHALPTLARSALEIGLEIDHVVYDCFFLALAIREQAQLVTADHKFLTALAGTAYQQHARLL